MKMNEVKTFTSGKTTSDEKIFKRMLEFWKMYIHTVNLTASLREFSDKIRGSINKYVLDIM